MILPSLLKESELQRRTHSSKLWPPTEVLVTTGTGVHWVADRLSTRQMADYVDALLGRWIFGISDLADRNFLARRDGRLVAIDEEIRGRAVNFQVELKKNRCAIIEKWITKHFEELSVQTWSVPQDKTKRLKLVQSKENILLVFRGHSPRE